MISALKKRYDDKFSHYFDPKELRQFDQSNSGQFSGVGLTVTGVNRGSGCRPSCPTARRRAPGSSPGDVIVGVDGQSIAGRIRRMSRSANQGAGRARRVDPHRPLRRQAASRHDVQLERASVKLPAARGPHAARRRHEGRRTCTSRPSARGSHGELATAIKRLDQKGAKGLVLDLRGNRGGLLNEAVLAASLFLKKGQRVVSTRSRTQGTRTTTPSAIRCRRCRRGPDRPQHRLRGRDPDLGARGAPCGDHRGDAVVRQGDLPGGASTSTAGGALDLTVGKYFTAERHLAAGKGITPDVKVRTTKGTKQDERLQQGALPCWRRTARSRTGDARAGRAGLGQPSRERRAPGPLHGRRAAVRARAPGDACRGLRGLRPGDIALVDFGAGGAKVLRRSGSAERARDVVDALLWDRGARRGFTARDRGRGAGCRRPRPRGASGRTARPDRARRPSPLIPATARDFDDAVSARPRTGRRPALDPHRRRVGPRPAGRRAGRRGASARHQHLRARRGRADASAGLLSDDACSLAPGVERLAVTAEIVLGGERRAAVGELLSEPHPLGRAPRLRPAGRVLRGTQLSRPPRSRPALGLARRAAAALAAQAARSASLEIESFEPEFEFDGDGAVVRAHSVHADRGPQADRAPDDPHQRAGGRALERRHVPTHLPRPRAARPAADRAAGRASSRSLGRSHAARCRGTSCLPQAGRAGRGDQPHGREARRRGAGTAATRIHLSCSAP